MARLIPALLILLSLFCSSCNYIFTSAYGLKNAKSLDQKQIAKQAKKYKVPAEKTFELDPAYYTNFLRSFDTIQYGAQVKNHYQPLQAMYFDKKGKLQNFHINCYAGGFPNMKWNRDGNFETFPPKQQAPIDSLVNFHTLNRYLLPIANTKPISEISDDYTIVVFWSRVMGRQSKRLIQTVQQNATRANNHNIRLLYVNNDNIMAKLWK